MMPNVVRGGNAGGLIVYLFGPGRANEHTDQHIVASSTMMQEMGWGVGERMLGGSEEARACGADLEAPVRNHNRWVMRYAQRFNHETGKMEKKGWKVQAHVWHCSLSLHPDEPALSDEQWNGIVTDFMNEMGFGADGSNPECRWVAVRHGVSKNGGDHVHIAATVVRENGVLWRDYNDHVRTQKTCTKLEKKYGLVVVPSREKEIGSIGEEPWERMEAEQLFEAEHGKPFEYPEGAQSGREEAVTASTPLSVRGRLETAMRAASGCSANEREYVEALNRLGVYVRPRYAKNEPENVTGYSVGLAVEDGSIRWMSPSKIARDLSLPRLRSEAFRDSETARMEALEAWSNGMNAGEWSDPEMDMSPSTNPHSYGGSSAQEALLKEIQGNAESMQKLLSGEHSEEEFAWATRVISEQYAVAAFFIGKDGWKLAQTSRMIARLGAYKKSPYTRPRPSPVVRHNRNVLFGKRSLRRAYAYPQTLNALAFTVETLMDIRADARATKRYLRECDMAIATLESAQKNDHYAYWDYVYDNHPMMSEEQAEKAKLYLRGIVPEYENDIEEEKQDKPSYVSPSFKPPTFGDNRDYSHGKGL